MSTPNEHPRVPMRRSRSPVWDDSDHVATQFEPPLTGRKFSMFVSEELLAQFGQRAMEEATKHLGQHIVYEHQGTIDAVVSRVLLDPEFMKPIIEQELRRAVRNMVLSLWNDEEKKNLRDWFDLFTAKCQEEQP